VTVGLFHLLLLQKGVDRKMKGNRNLVYFSIAPRDVLALHLLHQHGPHAHASRLTSLLRAGGGSTLPVLVASAHGTGLLHQQPTATPEVQPGWGQGQPACPAGTGPKRLSAAACLIHRAELHGGLCTAVPPRASSDTSAPGPCQHSPLSQRVPRIPHPLDLPRSLSGTHLQEVFAHFFPRSLQVSFSGEGSWGLKGGALSSPSL